MSGGILTFARSHGRWPPSAVCETTIERSERFAYGMAIHPRRYGKAPAASLRVRFILPIGARAAEFSSQPGEYGALPSYPTSRKLLFRGHPQGCESKAEASQTQRAARSPKQDPVIVPVMARTDTASRLEVYILGSSFVESPTATHHYPVKPRTA